MAPLLPARIPPAFSSACTTPCVSCSRSSGGSSSFRTSSPPCAVTAHATVPSSWPWSIGSVNRTTSDAHSRHLPWRLSAKLTSCSSEVLRFGTGWEARHSSWSPSSTCGTASRLRDATARCANGAPGDDPASSQGEEPQREESGKRSSHSGGPEEELQGEERGEKESHGEEPGEEQQGEESGEKGSQGEERPCGGESQGEAATGGEEEIDGRWETAQEGGQSLELRSPHPREGQAQSQAQSEGQGLRQVQSESESQAENQGQGQMQSESESQAENQGQGQVPGEVEAGMQPRGLSAERELPVFAVQWALLPGAQDSLHIFMPRYVLMFQKILAGAPPFLYAHLLMRPGRRTPLPGDVATVAQITSMRKLNSGRLLIESKGLGRVRVHQISQRLPYVSASVARVMDEEELAVEAYMRELEGATSLGPVLHPAVYRRHPSNYPSSPAAPRSRTHPGSDSLAETGGQAVAELGEDGRGPLFPLSWTDPPAPAEGSSGGRGSDVGGTGSTPEGYVGESSTERGSDVGRGNSSEEEGGGPSMRAEGSSAEAVGPSTEARPGSVWGTSSDQERGGAARDAGPDEDGSALPAQRAPQDLPILRGQASSNCYGLYSTHERVAGESRGDREEARESGREGKRVDGEGEREGERKRVSLGPNTPPLGSQPPGRFHVRRIAKRLIRAEQRLWACYGRIRELSSKLRLDGSLPPIPAPLLGLVPVGFGGSGAPPSFSPTPWDWDLLGGVPEAHGGLFGRSQWEELVREWQEEGGGGEESGDESEDEGGEEGGEGADLERDELRGSATGAGSEGESGSVNASEVGKEERGSILSSSLSPEALGALEEDPSRAYASERGAEEVGDRGNAAAGNHGSGTGSQDATPSGSSDEAGDDPGRSSGEPSTSGERLDEADASGDGLRAPRGLWHRRRTQEALMVIMRMQLLSFAAAALVEELPRGEGRQELLESRSTLLRMGILTNLLKQREQELQAMVALKNAFRSY